MRVADVDALGPFMYGSEASAEGLCGVIRDIVREELRKLLPVADRPASLSHSHVVRKEAQRAFKLDSPADVTAFVEPGLTYAAATRRPTQPSLDST